MKLFGLEIKRAGKGGPGLQRITRPSATDFGWYGTKLSPSTVRQLLNGMRAGDLNSGFELFAEMQDTWHTLAKNLQQLREAVAGVRYNVVPYTTEGEAPSAGAIDRSALCRRVIQNFEPEPATDENGFEDFIYDLTDALVLGVSLQEILWREADGEILPRAACWVHPNQYGLGNDGRFGLAVGQEHYGTLYQAQGTLAGIDRQKFVIGAYKTRSGTRVANGLLRALAWWWCGVQYGRDWLLRNAELFGQPIRDIEYDKGISAEDLAKLEEMAAEMGSSAWLTRPVGTKLTLLEAQRTGENSPQADLLDRADRAADLMILWQTLTSTVGDSGSLALGDVHRGVRRERVQNIAAWVANVVSYQLFPAACQLNYGDADECPKLVADFSEQENAKARAERLRIAGELVPLPRAWTYEQLGVPQPIEGEATVQPRPPAAAPEPVGFALRGRETPPAATDAVAALRGSVAAALARARGSDLAPVRTAAGPLVARITAALAMTDDRLVAELAALRPELTAFEAQLPSLLAAANRDPAAAAALASGITAALFNAMDDAHRLTKGS